MATGATHFGWRQDVADLVARVEFEFSGLTAGNTYFDHPIVWPQFSFFDLDFVSVDFWGPGGRGHTIDFDVGEAIDNFVWFDPFPPFIRYRIWQGELLTIPPHLIGTGEFFVEPYGNPFDTFSDDVHERHIHFTFWHP
jgi:hypothetical protein